MLERQREGVAKAKAEGKYRGRAPTARAKSGDVIAKFKADQRPSDIAKSLGIGRASVYRILSGTGAERGLAGQPTSVTTTPILFGTDALEWPASGVGNLYYTSATF
jgi:DNA invertase Pin-like site-specific DNA recombinase